MSRYKDHPIYGSSPSTEESVVLTRACLNPALVACFLCLATIFELGTSDLWTYSRLPLYVHFNVISEFSAGPQ
jgi:hypothetical protein